MSSGRPSVLAEGLGLDYPSGRSGLVGLDLEVVPGEVVVALGPNGSGKTSLLRLLATDLAPDRGRLEILGRSLGHRGSLRALRRRIGYAPDTPLHVPWLTGEEHARFLAEVRGYDAADEETALRELLVTLGLGEVAGVQISAYSFGMRRKLLLVEALASAPDLLLLDEPTVGLDPPGTEALRAAVEGAAGRGGAVVIASNETREVPRWADRVLFLHRGELVEAAAPDELLARLRGRTRIEVDLDGPSGTDLDGFDPEGIPGIQSSRWAGTNLRVESSRGGEPLPPLLGALISAGRAVRDVRVREPDLGDLFLELTGAPLHSARDEAPSVREAIE